jgi:adenylate cyclase
VVPYVVDGLLGDTKQLGQVISEHAAGLDLFLDTAALDDHAAARARQALHDALVALEQHPRLPTV